MTTEMHPAPLCAICMTPAGPDEASASCPACRATYHAGCWTENGGCAVYGCSRTPATEGLKPLEIPPAFWGREEKNCPACDAVIAAMAVRCRHCGAMVVARPEEKASYEKRKSGKERAPGLRRGAVALVILSLIPLVAAPAAVAGWLFYRRRGADIRKLPGSYDGLYRIAIGVAAAQSVIILVAVLAFVAKEVLKR